MAMRRLRSQEYTLIKTLTLDINYSAWLHFSMAFAGFSGVTKVPQPNSSEEPD